MIIRRQPMIKIHHIISSRLNTLAKQRTTGINRTLLNSSSNSIILNIIIITSRQRSTKSITILNNQQNRRQTSMHITNRITQPTSTILRTQARSINQIRITMSINFSRTITTRSTRPPSRLQIIQSLLQPRSSIITMRLNILIRLINMLKQRQRHHNQTSTRLTNISRISRTILSRLNMQHRIIRQTLRRTNRRNIHSITSTKLRKRRILKRTSRLRLINRRISRIPNSHLKIIIRQLRQTITIKLISLSSHSSLHQIRTMNRLPSTNTQLSRNRQAPLQQPNHTMMSIIRTIRISKLPNISLGSSLLNHFRMNSIITSQKTKSNLTFLNSNNSLSRNSIRLTRRPTTSRKPKIQRISILMIKSTNISLIPRIQIKLMKRPMTSTISHNRFTIRLKNHKHTHPTTSRRLITTVIHNLSLTNRNSKSRLKMPNTNRTQRPSIITILSRLNNFLNKRSLNPMLLTNSTQRRFPP